MWIMNCMNLIKVEELNVTDRWWEQHISGVLESFSRFSLCIVGSTRSSVVYISVPCKIRQVIFRLVLFRVS